MKIITRQDLANIAAKRWNEQYARDWNRSPFKEIGYTLAALVDPTPEKVEEIIGNRSWTTLKCNECNREVETVIEVGEPMDYESQTAHLCTKCITEAYEAISNFLKEK